jgi:hypothetical protein
MTKELTLEQLHNLLAKAQTNYANCGCRVYLEEINTLTAKIAQAEKQ